MQQDEINGPLYEMQDNECNFFPPLSFHEEQNIDGLILTTYPDEKIDDDIDLFLKQRENSPEDGASFELQIFENPIMDEEKNSPRNLIMDLSQTDNSFHNLNKLSDSNRKASDQSYQQ
mmetsp:Transcript_18849/g.18011  ORF Transcript_18849/g.18011 Transcript_18849/m.18011 type:complete len:118 (+) Transcript_18849:6-359(+)